MLTNNVHQVVCTPLGVHVLIGVLRFTSSFGMGCLT